MTENVQAIFYLALIGISAIIFYEIVCGSIKKLRSKFIPAYHIEVLRAHGSPWWFWEIIQGEKGGNYRFTYKEAVEFKAKEVNDPWGDRMRIVQSR